MPFIHPALFLGGAAAASVPIIIHLLNRRRFRVLDWAAMRFLLESVRKNRRRIRIEELILLFLRCLAIFLLAVAVGRFIGCSPMQILPVGMPAQISHVFILDDSVSMGQKLADTTAFTKAASDLADMLGEIPTTDKVAVLLTSRPERDEAVFDMNFLTDPEVLSTRIRSLKPSDTTTQLHHAARTAVEILKETQTKKRLYVLSDFRREDYSSGGMIEDARRQFNALADAEVELVLMNYGAAASGNLTAVDIQMLDKLAVASVPVRVQLRVRNNGPERAENVAVRFVVRSTEGPEVTLPVRTIRSIDPGQTEPVQISYNFSNAGSAVIEAHLPADSLAGDNTAFLAMDVRDARKVLIVDGEPDISAPVGAESFYLAFAMDPTGDGRYGNKTDVVSGEHLGEVNFETYDVVILANVGQFPLTVDPGGGSGYGQLDALSRYVRSGGGLAIFTGDRVNPDFYNGPFYDRGKGLCPIQIAAPAGDARKKMKFVRLSPKSISNESVMRTFQGRRGQFTQMVRFYAYTPMEQSGLPASLAEIGPVRVLARFDNTDGATGRHSPAIVARAYGQGEVMMICTSADKEWTDWPKDLTYLAFINDMIEHLSRRGGRKFTSLVGRQIDYTVAPEMASARITLQTPAFPAEDVIALAGQRIETGRVVTYQNPRHMGIYQLKLDVTDEVRTVLFARNVDPLEGRLARITEKELQGQLPLEFRYLDRLTPAGPKEAAASAQQEYWKAALAAMLLILAAEVFLAQRFGHYKK
ncbi:MAG: BatA domain-containing protein [Planctomycetota bacterium]|nr:BatA domain-containing protein [Planctomycetota bacterium]